MPDLAAAVEAVRARTDAVPALALVLGSGLGGLADAAEEPVVIPTEDVPGYPRSTVEGHAGRLVFGRLGVGYGMWFPSALAQNAFGSIHLDGSLGVEYYTKLRHLSVGVEAAFQSLLLPFAFGVALYPTVKYTF